MGASVSSERNIVLLGKIGDGKSSAGNTILRKNIFTPDSSPNSVTDTSVIRKGKVYGRKLTIIDTPGVFDTARDDARLKSEVIRSIVNCAAGIHAFVIVMKVDRFTRNVEEAVEEISKSYGKETLKHSVVLFTHGEQLEGRTIEEFVQENPKLQEFVDRCGGRCHVIDNKYWSKCLHCPISCGYKSNRTQVKHLLDTIDDMVQENGCYTNEMLQRVQRMIEAEMMNGNAENASPNQQRERAERNVYSYLLLKFAGVLAGALTGGLMGIGFCVAIILSSLQAMGSSAAAAVQFKAGGVAGEAAGEAARGAMGEAAGGVAGKAAGGVAGGVAGKAAGGVAGKAAGGVAGEAAGGVAGGVAGKAAGGVAGEAAGGVAGEAAGGVAGKAAGGVAGKAAGAAAGGAGFGAYAAGVTLSVAALGSLAGAAVGWDAADEADSVSDAFIRGAAAAYENGRAVTERAQEYISLIFKPRAKQ